MQVEGQSIVVQTGDMEPVPFATPGATPDRVTAKLVNVDAAKGLVTTITHIASGAHTSALPQ